MNCSLVLRHAVLCVLLAAVTACDDSVKTSPTPPQGGNNAGAKPPVQPDRPAKPLVLTEEMVRLNNEGVGLMGKFEYDRAYEVFAKLAKENPQWTVVRLNMAIAALNRQGVENLTEARQILEQVLREDAGNLRAQYCLAVLIREGGVTKLPVAFKQFATVADADPTDSYAAYFAGQCLSDLNKREEALKWFRKSAAVDAYLLSAFKNIFETLRLLGREDEAKEAYKPYDELINNLQKRTAEIKYTLMGPKALAVTVDLAELPPLKKPAGPVFAEPAPLVVQLPRGVQWATFDAAEQPSLTACDINGDGRVDLFVAGQITIDGHRANAVLISGEMGWKLDAEHPLARVDQVTAALWGDYDNDGLTDAYLCRNGPNQLWRQTAKGKWENVAEKTLASGGDFHTADGALVDADHDGDLDILLVRSKGPTDLLNNSGDGTFKSLGAKRGLAGDGRPARSLVVADLDHDRDADFIVLHTQPPHDVFLNERLSNYRRGGDGFGELASAPIESALVADANADGRIELYTLSPDAVQRWNADRSGRWKPTPLAAGLSTGPRPAQLAAADVDGDGMTDLLFSTAEGWRCIRLGGDGATLFDARSPGLANWSLLLDDSAAGPVIVACRGQQPPLVWRAGPGRHNFVAVRLAGQIDPGKQMRSNASGIGVKLAARFGSRWAAAHTFREQSGPGQSLQPRLLGLAGAKGIDFLGLDWPDGAYESEMGLVAGKLHRINELNRIPTSCPILFVWDGTGWRFVTDCLGVGGLGYATGPGTYARPRPRESLLIPALPVADRAGRIPVKLLEPSEEVTYLDAARLTAYDLPPTWHMTLDERMSDEDHWPTGEPLYYRRQQVATRATNDRGQDVTRIVAEADRVAAEPGAIDRRFIGRTEEHVLELTFAEPLDAGPGSPLLVADGWVEFPYSQTIYAASQARADYRSPTLEACDSAGKWQTLLDPLGYPAGMPRQMAVPLPVERLPLGCTRLRIRTNLEVYWDRIAVAWSEPCPQAKRTPLTLEAATLGTSGFPRRTVGPQRQPNFDYARCKPIEDVRYPPGYYTATGDVRELVGTLDDALAIFGPGEEVHMEFAAPPAPAPALWRRAYVLDTFGWCKDTDLYTKDGDTLGPLPAREDSSAAALHARDRLHNHYNTRHEAGRQ